VIVRGLFFFLIVGALLWWAGGFFASGNDLSDISARDLKLPDWSLPRLDRGRGDDAPARSAPAIDDVGEVVPVTVAGVFLAPASMAPVVVLEDVDGGRSLTIFIGYAEADAIRRRLEDESSPRPLTHDLLGESVRALGGRVENVTVTDMDQGTYFAMVNVDARGGNVSIDARPSDAIALALVEQAPVFVARDLMDLLGEELVRDTDTDDARDVGCGLRCQPLDPELAGALGVESGVVISDLSEVQSDGGLLLRGDVLMELGGQSADDVERVSELLSGLDDGDSLPVTIHRDGRRLEVIFRCRE
jgi:bifunctional DNase/RNase